MRLCLPDAELPPPAPGPRAAARATVTPIGSRLGPAADADQGRPAERARVPAPGHARQAPEQEESAPAVPVPRERPARKAAGGRSRRSSVPSWDEIMFGTTRPTDSLSRLGDAVAAARCWRGDAPEPPRGGALLAQLASPQSRCPEPPLACTCQCARWTPPIRPAESAHATAGGCLGAEFCRAQAILRGSPPPGPGHRRPLSAGRPRDRLPPHTITADGACGYETGLAGAAVGGHVRPVDPGGRRRCGARFLSAVAV